MNPIVQRLIKEGHLTEKQAERISRRVQSFVKEAENNPALLDQALEKLGFENPLAWARMRPALENYLPVAVVAAGTSLAAAGATGLAGKAYQTIKDSLVKAKGYKQMVEVHGEDILSEVPAEVSQRLYNTLYRFNPEFAGDPTVAATFVKTIAGQERLDLAQVKALVEARKTMSETETNPFAAQMFDVMRAMPDVGKAMPRAESPQMKLPFRQ